MNTYSGKPNILARLVFSEILNHLRIKFTKKMPIECITCVYVCMYVFQTITKDYKNYRVTHKVLIFFVNFLL